MLLEPVEARPRAGREQLSVDAELRESPGRGPRGEVGVVALARGDERSEECDAPAAPVLHDPGEHGLLRLGFDRHPALGAVLHAELHEEQAQERVDLGERGHRALAAAPAGALLDGDGRRHAENAVDVGPVRGLDELPGVGVQRLEVPALPLGEDDVEGERALAAAAHAGDHAEGVPGDAHVEVAEVVLARVPDDDLAGRGPARPGGARARGRRGGSAPGGRRRVPAQRREALGAQGSSGAAAGAALHVGRSPFAHEAPAGVAPLRAEVDHPVGGPDHVEVVLDDDHRVARVGEPPQGGEQARDVLEVEAGGRLVEEEERAAGRLRRGGGGEVAGQLQPLGLPAAQRRHRLSQGEVAEPDLGERREGSGHLRLAREERAGLVDGHVEHVGDRARGDGRTGGRAARRQDAHLEHLAAVPPSVAVGAAQVHVAQELHLHVLEPAAAAGGAPARARVEAEGARGVAALARERVEGEEAADRVEGAHVADGVRPGGAPDGRLVDEHRVVDELVAGDEAVPARGVHGLPLQLAQPVVEDVLHQRGLAAAAHSRHAHHPAQRERDVEVLQVVLGGALHHEVGHVPHAGRGEARGPARRLHLPVAPQVRPRHRPPAREQAREAAEVHHLPAARAGARAHVEHEVRGPDHVGVVLDHDEGVAGVAQALQHGDQPADVARVQADARLVEHEQGVHERGAERGGQVDALHLAAAEGAGLPVQGEVAEADVHEVGEARAHLGEQQLRGLVEAAGQAQRPEEARELVDRQQRRVVDREPALADLPQQGLGLQARAPAGGAGRVGTVARQQDPDVHPVAARLQPLEEPSRAVPLLVLPGALAVEHPAPVLLGELAPRHVHRHAAPAGEGQQVVLALLVRLGLPRLDGAALQGPGVVGHDEAPVDAHGPAESAAGVAGADRRVEREEVRHRVAVVDVALRAVQVGGEAPGGARPGSTGGVEPVHAHPALAVLQCRLEVLDEPAAAGLAERDAVLHHLEPARLACVDPGVALLREQVEHLVLGEVVRHGDGEGDEGAAGSGSQQLVGDALGGVPPDRPAALPAVQRGGPGVEQLQVVGQLGHRADRRARGAHRVGLVDGDGRGDAVDPVDARLVHALEELPGVGGEGLDVPALALGVEGVEGQRGLAAAAHAGHHDQLPERQLQVEALQVVLPRPLDEDEPPGRAAGSAGSGRASGRTRHADNIPHLGPRGAGVARGLPTDRGRAR